MAQAHEKLARSLDALKILQADGRRVFRTGEFGRTDRERLMRNGFLREIMKGWVFFASPDTREGDSTPWFASFWEFCARYCHQRFGQDWHLSPEQSLLLHAGSTAIPQQVIIYSRKGTNNTVDLPFNTSVFDLKHKETLPKGDLSEVARLRLYAVPAALVKVPESFYRRFPIEAQVVLAGISEPGVLLRRLLAGGHSVIAGRLVAAFRRLGKADIADQISAAMNAAEYPIRESDPFDPGRTFPTIRPSATPIVARLEALWKSHRRKVIKAFPPAPGLPGDGAGYLRAVEEIYQSDAYHSLSIEGYRVRPELIERVRSGAWNPEEDEHDRANVNALAARGYWQAFQIVKEDVARVISGTPPDDRVRRSHQSWYRALFQPCVSAGLTDAEALAGYRTEAVFLRNSRHIPPRSEAVRDAMPTLLGLLSQENEPSVRAVLGHWLLGYIHPYPDGTGRMARFLMNVMLASGGYPWTVIRVDDRDAYLSALEAASVESEAEPFVRFIAERVRKAM